ncbi:hypothetical protein EDC04DRAFT_2605304 [Pisolithus marmoratus]|nr:hypothetical protein EDC04DRAFT_2605304 [Pisolithus marmoratus]
MTNPQSNNNTANTINQNAITQGTSNAMQVTDMGTAIAAALNISLAEDTGESSNMNLDSAAPMETGGRGGDPNTELEMMETTGEDDANTNNENQQGGDKTGPKETSNAKGKQRAADSDEEGASGSEEEGADPNTEPEIMEITREDALNTNTENQQGGEKSAPKKSSKAKGKKKATGKDGEGEISGAKKRVTEKKMTHAIKEVKKTSIQEFMEHIWGVINKATLGYALMTVMDDNGLGTGPTIQCCQVNIQPIDPAFLEEFAKGEHAMDVGVHRRDIDLASLQPAKDTPYSNRSAHSVPYLQYLKAKDKLCTASSGQMYDAFQEAMQVAHKVVRDGGIWLIRFFDLDFIDAHTDRALIESHLAANAILPVHQDTTSQLGRILRDRVLFDTVFNLFQYKHFHSWDNTGTGLSICNIYKWLPTIGGDWTDIYVKMGGSSEKEDQLAPIEFFGTMQMDEAQNYSRYMSNYWDAMVAHAERERDSTIYVARDANTGLIKKSMPIKLKALHHELMGKILGDKFADQFPVPTKVLMYTLGEQLRSIEPAIGEHFMAKKLQKGLVFKNYIPFAQNSMSDLDEKKFTVGALGQILDTYVKACSTCALKAGITAADAPARLSLPDLEPPEIIEDELEPEQFKFLEFVSQVLHHTSFPWMDSTKLKKSDTLLKKLVPLYKSYRAHCTLLGTDVTWRIWHTLICVLMVGVQKKDKSWRWEWLDGFAEAPEVNAEEKCDHCNHDKLKLIIHTALSPEFGLGLGDRALPKAHELVGKLVDELKLCSEIAVHHLWCPTQAFVPESPREMDILYPLDIPDPMSAEDTRCYKDKQLGSGLANLSSLPTFDNAAKDLWVAERKATQAEEQRQCELMKQHERVKVVQSERAERVAKVAEMRRATPIILDSDEEGVDMEDTAPKAGPSNTTNASTANMSQSTMPYSWEGFKTIAKQANPDIAFKELPALLYLLLMGLGCQASKYVKKAQELVTEGIATGMITVKEAAQWFE